MARAFEEVINANFARFAPQEAKRHHIALARRTLADYMARQTVRPEYRIETDGRHALSEESVKPFGVIVYRFLRMREIARFAIAEAVRLSPERSGRYKKSWFLLVANAETPPESVPHDATVTLTNDQPYSRKINVGAKGFEKYARPGIVEKVKALVSAKYRAVVDVKVVYLALAGGYVLKRDGRYASGKRAGRIRRNARAGSDLTYPALILTPRF